MPSTTAGTAYEEKNDGVILGSKPESRPVPNYKEVKQDDDFGFSGMSIGDSPEKEQSVEEVLNHENASLKSEISKYKIVNKNIIALFMNLLDNLSKNPDKDTIIWKGAERTKTITEVKAKISGWVKDLT